MHTLTQKWPADDEIVPEFYFKQITDMTDNTILSTIYEWMFK